jgi:hypothetical protein
MGLLSVNRMLEVAEGWKTTTVVYCRHYYNHVFVFCSLPESGSAVLVSSVVTLQDMRIYTLCCVCKA